MDGAVPAGLGLLTLVDGLTATGGLGLQLYHLVVVGFALRRAQLALLILCTFEIGITGTTDTLHSLRGTFGATVGSPSGTTLTLHWDLPTRARRHNLHCSIVFSVSPTAKRAKTRAPLVKQLFSFSERWTPPPPPPPPPISPGPVPYKQRQHLPTRRLTGLLFDWQIFDELIFDDWLYKRGTPPPSSPGGQYIHSA